MVNLKATIFTAATTTRICALQIRVVSLTSGIDYYDILLIEIILCIYYIVYSFTASL